jgi:hypothetical protein
MAPDRPDLTLCLGSTPINSDSESDSESDNDLSDRLYKWKQAHKNKRRFLKRLRKKHEFDPRNEEHYKDVRWL